MACEATSNTIHDVLLSKDIPYKSFKEICSGEPKKVNLGYFGDWGHFKVENNSLVHTPRAATPRIADEYIHGKRSNMPMDWEVLSKFFSNYNIEPNWLDCNFITGDYDEELGGWTGCIGQV